MPAPLFCACPNRMETSCAAYNDFCAGSYQGEANGVKFKRPPAGERSPQSVPGRPSRRESGLLYSYIWENLDVSKKQIARAHELITHSRMLMESIRKGLAHSSRIQLAWRHPKNLLIRL
jgi:hypothetical protein